MHMYLQIFPPTKFTFFGHDGLYRLRRWVVALWVLLPNLSAALAFANPEPAYMAQGGFCSLPLRPFWYRLALFWIPRYLIWVYVVFVAISITRYVGSEFKVFGQEKDSSTASQCVPDHMSSDAECDRTGGQRSSRHSSDDVVDVAPDDIDDVPPDDAKIIARIKSKKWSPPESRKSSIKNSTHQSSLVQWSAEDGAIINPFSPPN